MNQEKIALATKYSSELSTAFAENCFVKLPSFFEESIFNDLRDEALRLLGEHSNRKDFIMVETDNTPRHFSNVTGNVLHETKSLTDAIYTHPSLVNFLSKIAGEPLFFPIGIPERYAIHRMHKIGDIHGGHVDLFAFAFVICIESPGEDGGGELQFVPNELEISQLDSSNAIKVALKPGDCYFLHSNRSVHRVLPLKKEFNRTVIACGYADRATKDIERSYSTKSLYQ